MPQPDRPPRGRTLITTTAFEHEPNEADGGVAPIDADDPDAWVGVAMDAAEDKLGEKTVAYRVGDVMGIVEWFVVTTGRNERQVRAIADEVGPTPEDLNQDPSLRTDPNAIREARWWFEDYGVPWPE